MHVIETFIYVRKRIFILFLVRKKKIQEKKIQN